MREPKLYPPHSPYVLPTERLATNVLRLNVASMPFVGAKLKSFPYTRLSLTPPVPESIVVWPAHMNSPSPLWVAEL